jgi:hypothetical protein
MTCVRVLLAEFQRDHDLADASHLAELVRGDFLPATGRPPKQPLRGTIYPKGDGVLAAWSSPT